MKILFFSPNAGIIPHFSAEMRLANLLKSMKTYEIQFLMCDSFFERDCTVARYSGLKIDNEKGARSLNCKVCSDSISQSKVIADFKTSSLREYFGQVEMQIFQKQLNSMQKSPIDFVYDGIPFGKIAAYEIILEFKKKDLNFSSIEDEVLLAYTENCLRTYLAGRKFLQEFLPDRVIIFNPQYGVNFAFGEAAESLGIRVDNLAFSNVLAEMRSYIRLWNWTKYRNTTPGRFSSDYQSTDVKITDQLRIKRNSTLIRKAKSPWTYSQPAKGLDVRKILDIDQQSKIVLAVMNSLDEQFAAVTAGVLPENFGSKRVFADQDAWIKSLISFSANREDMVLVIRPHPREFPNKRDSVTAEVALTRRNLFENLPGNVRLDSPDLKIPIEDYFHEVIAITTGWSSVGLDWQIRGIDCVTYDANLPMYPESTHHSSKDEQQYFKQIEALLDDKLNSTDQLKINAMKWYVYSNLRGTARIGTSVLNEIYVGEFLRNIKITGILNRFLPKVKLWLDFNFFGLKTGKKKVQKYFEEGKDSLQEI